MDVAVMCTKIGYPSKHAARAASRHMRNTFRVYQCEDCQMKWHVTHR